MLIISYNIYVHISYYSKRNYFIEIDLISSRKLQLTDRSVISIANLKVFKLKSYLTEILVKLDCPKLVAVVVKSTINFPKSVARRMTVNFKDFLFTKLKILFQKINKFTRS